MKVELVSGSGSANNGAFKIKDNALLTDQVFDYETKSTYTIRVRVSDDASNTFESKFTINITNDTSEAAPKSTLSSNTVAENKDKGTQVGTFSTKGFKAPVKVELVSGSGSANNGAFKIKDNALLTDQVFDYETKSTYTIRARVSDDASNTFESKFTINITNDTSEPAPKSTLSSNTVKENKDKGTQVGTFSTKGFKAPVKVELVSGSGSANNGVFKIKDNALLTDQVFDYETKSTYTIRARVSDDASNTFEGKFTINITSDKNEADPVSTLSSNSVKENMVRGAEVGTFSTNGFKAPVKVELVSGSGSANNGAFKIKDNALQTNRVFDFESQSEYSIRVQITDTASNKFVKAFAIKVANDDSEDNDGDGLSERLENNYGSSDFAVDTDADGDADILEVYQGTDPNNKRQNYGIKSLIPTNPNVSMKVKYRRSMTQDQVDATNLWSVDLKNWHLSEEVESNGKTKASIKKKVVETGKDYEIVEATVRVQEGNPQAVYFKNHFKAPQPTSVGYEFRTARWTRDTAGTQSMNFNGTYTNPIVIASPLSHNGKAKAHVRVRTVSSTGFKYEVEEWNYLDGIHATDEVIHFLVMEQGFHRIGGKNWEAGSIEIDHSYKEVTLDPVFGGNQTILTQVTTNNGSAAVVVRMQNVNGNKFEMKLQEEEAEDGIHKLETVHYVAIQRGSGQEGSLSFKASSTGEAVTHEMSTIDFGDTYSNPFFFAQIRTTKGNNPAGLRLSSLSNTQATLFIEEEQSLDSEIIHNTPENINWLVIEAP